MAKIKLNNVDLAWLRMEQPTNPMMITVAFKFSGQVDYEQLLAILEMIVKRYRRFRQRVVIPNKKFQRPYWDDDPSFRIEHHLERVNLPLPADEIAVAELINQKLNSVLDFSHPLWKFTLVDNHPDGSIVIVNVHHCIADGISLLQVMLNMTQTSAEAQGDRAINDNGVAPVSSGEKTDESLPKTGRTTPHRTPNFIDMLIAILRIVFRSADPPTIFKGPLSPVKKAVWSKPLSVTEIKKFAKSRQATINDILMAITSSAFRRYMDLHNDKRIVNIRAFTMVNLRADTLDDELGNKFGLVFLDLPLDRAQPMERIEAIKQGMDFLKASAEYAASFLILNILGALPGWIERIATKILDTKGTVVATNVPGPRQQLYLAGAPIQTIQGWVPQSGRIGIGISFISYNDQLTVGLNVDAGLIPDPEVLLGLFVEEYKSFQTTLSDAPHN
jgi:diacylglycerol O-acyltransferase / wax synthase